MIPEADSAVFTDSYGIELLAEAYREGLVTTASSSGTTLTETEKNITNTINQNRKETALQQLVLRDRLYIPKRVIEYNGPAFESNNFIIEDSSLNEVIHTYKDALKPSDLSMINPAHRAKRRTQELEWCLENGMISPLYMMVSGEEGFDLGIGQFSGFVKRLAGKHYDEENVPSVKENRYLADAITQYLYLLRNLLEQSEVGNGPIVTDINLGQLRGERPAQVSEAERGSVALYFDNLKSVNVHSVRQALSLRESPHIQKFRAEVLGTVSDIRSNDITAEGIESRIESANRALGRANVATSTSRKLLFVLPILAPEFPITTTALTLGTFMYEFYAEQVAYDWAFVSSY